jgi:hypothetical protein
VTAGTWNVRDEALNLIGTLRIAQDGGFSETDADGCSISGNLTIIDMQFDVLRVHLTAPACNGRPAADFTGLATFQHTVPRKELVENADKHVAVGDRHEIADEEEDENAPADKEIIVEASTSSLSLAAFLTQK